MKLKLAITFAILGMSFAGAKSFQITLSTPTQAGTLALQPGQYDVSVNGTTVKFTEVNSGKSVATNATLENADKKFQNTAVDSSDLNGKATIQEIDLGGTVTKVKFQ
jgi:hypothetical protein